MTGESRTDSIEFSHSVILSGVWRFLRQTQSKDLHFGPSDQAAQSPKALYQGTTSVVPKRAGLTSGFNH
jgi:hypothetical protein